MSNDGSISLAGYEMDWDDSWPMNDDFSSTAQILSGSAMMMIRSQIYWDAVLFLIRLLD